LRSYRPVTIDLQEHECSLETDLVIAELEPLWEMLAEVRAPNEPGRRVIPAARCSIGAKTGAGSC
jgi:hypothetical protein